MALTRPAGTWTYDDLFSLPDDGKRYEIIEGDLYEMPAPSWVHVTVVMNLILLLGPLVRSLGGVLATAPADVFFEGADPVEPDIIVTLPGWSGKTRRRGLEGAPDLLIEVLSPSSRGHDTLTKRALYARAGVREYWIVDPENRTLEILTLDRDSLHTRQIATGAETAASPLLNDFAVPLAAVFARLDEIEDE
jgi:Uma2 family endonuclease